MSYNINLSAINLGACKIWKWVVSEWISLGATYGGTVLKYSPKYYDLKIDQLGETVVKKILQGESASISFGLAENNLDNLKLAMPFATVYNSGTQSALGIGVNAGGNLLEHTEKLKVHPINTRGINGTDDESFTEDDFIIWMAGNAEAVELPYSANSPRVYKVTMTIFPDFTKGAGRYLFIVGDPDVAGTDTTPPTVKSWYPANGATGIAADIDLQAVMSEPLRLNDDGLALAGVELKETSGHTNVAVEVATEQYIEGTAQAVDGLTMDLQANEIKADDSFNGLYLEIYGGTGAGDDLIEITDSAAANNRVTVAAWPNGAPDTDSLYRIHATRLTVSPESLLSNGVEYECVVSGAVDLAGNQQSGAELSSFTVIA